MFLTDNPTDLSYYRTLRLPLYPNNAFKCVLISIEETYLGPYQTSKM